MDKSASHDSFFLPVYHNIPQNTPLLENNQRQRCAIPAVVDYFPIPACPEACHFLSDITLRCWFS